MFAFFPRPSNIARHADTPPPVSAHTSIQVKAAIVVIGIIAWKVVLNIDASIPDLSGKPDGVYRGIYSVPPTPVEVEFDVTVKSGQLDKIDIVTHTASAIGKQAEKIIHKIIEKQSLDIDVELGTG
jgi:uncharacterized protein with FMN-binding domain